MIYAIDLTSLFDNLSGIERYALCITQEMLNIDYLNRYVLIFKNQIHLDFKKYENRKNIEFHILKGKNKLIFNQFVLLKHLYKIKADKYLFFAFPSPILFKRKGIFNTIHDMGAWDVPYTMKKLSKIYFKYSYINAARVSDGIFTVSKFTKERIIKLLKYDNDKIHIVPSGISTLFNVCKENDPQMLFEKYAIPSNYILCLSTLEPRKNMNLLLEAYNEVLDKVDYDLVLVGRKGWKVNEFLRKSEKIKNRIHLTGFIEDEDLPYIYKMAKCFVFTSIYEGFGLPPLEALSMGTTVISSNAASLPEVLEDKAIFFESNIKNDLVDKLIRLDTITQNSKYGVSKYQRETYNFKASANKVLQIIDHMNNF